MLATIKMLLVYLSLGPIAGIIGIPYTLLVGNINRLYRVAMWIMAAGVRAAGIVVEVSGRENIPLGQSCIFMCNHVSNLDPPVVLPMLPGRSSVLLKKELMRIPILGTAMTMAKFVPIDRGSRPEAAQASVAAAAEALRSGLNILVYPEGTRARDGRLQAFKKGPFFLAQQTAAPIVPVVITGTERMMHKGSAAIFSGVAEVRFLDPLFPQEYATREEIQQAVRQAITNALPTEMQPIVPDL